MPNYIYVSKTATPNPQISTWWLPTDEGTVVDINIFGVRFGFILEPSPARLPPDVVDDVLLEFPLAGDSPDPANDADG